jgi:nucleotide-binding universal stress UspA family protein
VNDQTNDPRGTALRPATVVGVDTTDDNQAAIRWAAEVARRDSLLLEVVHVVDEAWRGSPFYTPAEVERAVHGVIAGAVEAIQSDYPDVTLIRCPMFGSTTQKLRSHAEGAVLLVLGRGGESPMLRRLLGSVSAAIGNQPTIPTAVIPGGWVAEEHVSEPIVVGVDGSPTSLDALKYAIELTDHTSAAVRVVQAWAPDPLFATLEFSVREALASWRDKAESLVRTAALPWRDKYPDLEITVCVRQGHTVGVLVDESMRAQLLIVGAHPASTLRAFAIGSTTDGVLRHARCPVIVVPRNSQSAEGQS